ncbi:MAG TPA: SET domain-containing protein [Candidatus Nitrosocosmicus sp.]|nr:SET domain-containing protein [Candidatus Nitrosocosmicus sp.]
MFIIDPSFWEVRMTQKKGRGIYAKKEIVEGTVIGDYIGIVMRACKISEEEHGLYDMWYSDEASILANPNEIGVHLMNHSCMPNCETYTYKDRTLFFALRRIYKHEELTISYDLGPPDNKCNPCMHACFCKTILCKGSMHSSDDSSKRWKHTNRTAVERMFDVKPDDLYGKKLVPLPKYPMSIKDNPSYYLYANMSKKPQIEYSNFSNMSYLREIIRSTGRSIYFPKLNINVIGLIENIIYSISENNE